MRAALTDVLTAATADGRAVAACNVYTLDQAAGIVEAAEDEATALILQLHPGGLGDGLWPMLAGVRVLVDRSAVPCVVHLDHCTDLDIVARAADAGVDSVMVDESGLTLADNLQLVTRARLLLGRRRVGIEAELGRLSGTEDGLSVDERAARLTDPSVVRAFVEATGVVALAASIGNVHGETPVEPALDLPRLEAIRAASPVPLVLHGASGLSAASLQAVITRGVAKVNVNNELRRAYATAMRGEPPGTELVSMLAAARASVRQAAREVIRRLAPATAS